MSCGGAEIREDDRSKRISPWLQKTVPGPPEAAALASRVEAEVSGVVQQTMLTVTTSDVCSSF